MYRGVRQQVVKIEGTRGDQVAITSGINPGDEVVSSGVFRLRNGAPGSGEQHGEARQQREPQAGRQLEQTWLCGDSRHRLSRERSDASTFVGALGGVWHEVHGFIR